MTEPLERVKKLLDHPDLLAKLVDVITNLDESEFQQAAELAKARSRQRQYAQEQEMLRAQMQAELRDELARAGGGGEAQAILSARLLKKYRAKGLDSGKLLSEFISEREERRRKLTQSLSHEEFQKQQALWNEYRQELLNWKAGGALSASREMMIRQKFANRGLKFELFDFDEA